MLNVNLYCDDCDEVFSEDELLDYWYSNSSTHYIEEVKCKCGNKNLVFVEDEDNKKDNNI